MAGYDIQILKGLLDSYERSLLSQGKNKVTVHISFPFTRKNLPEYFNESSLAYEKIHSSVRVLEEQELVTAVWKNGKEGHIIEKVLLNDKNVAEAYAYLNRKPRREYVRENLELLEEAKERYQTPILQGFLAYLQERLIEGKSVKEFIDIEKPDKTRKILKAVGELENNREDCYIREFSIRHFGNSKTLTSMLGVVRKILQRFGEGFEDMDDCGILAEYSVYHTPDYVYIKGMGELIFGEDLSTVVNLTWLKQGIGLSGEDIGRVRILENSKIKKILTIENLTTFFRWKEKDSLMIYLGGYHNSVRRKLLELLHQSFPEAEYLHFGDIDVGGFEIYRDLCRKTGIPFKTYHMGIEELEKYKSCTQKLTEGDCKRLEVLIRKMESEGGDTRVLQYMKEKGRKLEQEGIEQT